MSKLITRRHLRSGSLLGALTVTSLLVSAAILIFAKAKTGTPLGCLTDHLHHTRATWNFFALGFDVYRLPHAEACARVPYPHDERYGCGWGTWPMAYPPGMFAVFTVPALFGRIGGVSELEFGKFTLAYLTLVTHAALWAFANLARRVRSTLWMGIVAFFWLFMVRLALVGLYEGAWLLTAAIAVDALCRSKPARALLWLSATALLSYRAVCLVPIALFALWQMPRAAESKIVKAVATLSSVGTVVTVLACARALVRHGPGDAGHSPFIPLQPYGWLLLGVGIIVAIAVTYTSPLVGVSVAFSSFLSLYHAGHNWHATVCVAPLFALVLSRRRPLWLQVTLGLWFVFYLQYVFGYPPLLWAEELIGFVERGGRPGCVLPFE